MIELSALTKRYGTFTAVDALDLDVPRGELFGFLGPNGAGKTTTLRMIAGILRPTSGSVRIAGIDVAAGLQPDAEALVAVEQDATAADDEGGARDVDGIGVLVERPVEAAHGGDERLDARPLALVHRHAAADCRQDVLQQRIGVVGGGHGDPSWRRATMSAWTPCR